MKESGLQIWGEMFPSHGDIWDTYILLVLAILSCLIVIIKKCCFEKNIFLAFNIFMSVLI